MLDLPQPTLAFRLGNNQLFHYIFSLDGVVAVVEEMDLREYSDVGQPGGHWGSSVCLDYVELYSYLDNQNSFEPKQQNKLCGR